MSLQAKIILASLALLGIALGWYGSATIAGPAIRVTLVGHRTLAALLAGSAAALAASLWHRSHKRVQAISVLVAGAAAVVGIGFWMMP